MDEECFGWLLPEVANDDGQIRYFQQTARPPQTAADADGTAISHQGLTYVYTTIDLSNSSQTDDLRCLIHHIQSLEAQLGTVTTVRDEALVEAETWGGWCDTFFQMMACLGVGGNGGGGGCFLKSHFEQHQPPLFTGDLKLETVNLFPRKVEHWVRQGGAAMGTTEPDKCIDSAWHFICPEVYGWFAHSICQQDVMVIPPADGSFAPVIWPLSKFAFCHCFVPEVAITAVRKEIHTLRNSGGVGGVAHFKMRFSELIHIQPKVTTIARGDSLNEDYYSKLTVGIADQIIASAPMQKMLQPGTPFTLAVAVEMVGEFSDHITSHPAITPTSVNHGANFVPPNAATVPTPVSPEPMDLTVANTNTRCHHCNGFGHEARDGATPDTPGRSQAFRARTGGNHSRQDGGRDCTNTRCAGQGTLARPAAGGIDNVQAVAVEDASVNDDGEDSPVEQEVVEEEDGKANGNWE